MANKPTSAAVASTLNARATLNARERALRAQQQTNSQVRAQREREDAARKRQNDAARRAQVERDKAKAYAKAQKRRQEIQDHLDEVQERRRLLEQRGGPGHVPNESEQKRLDQMDATAERLSARTDRIDQRLQNQGFTGGEGTLADNMPSAGVMRGTQGLAARGEASVKGMTADQIERRAEHLGLDIDASRAKDGGKGLTRAERLALIDLGAGDKKGKNPQPGTKQQILEEGAFSPEEIAHIERVRDALRAGQHDISGKMEAGEALGNGRGFGDAAIMTRASILPYDDTGIPTGAFSDELSISAKHADNYDFVDELGNTKDPKTGKKYTYKNFTNHPDTLTERLKTGREQGGPIFMERAPKPDVFGMLASGKDNATFSSDAGRYLTFKNAFQEIQKMHKDNPAMFRKLQEQMLNAGFYDTGEGPAGGGYYAETDAQDPLWNRMDPDTIKAVYNTLAYVADQALPQGKTMTELLWDLRDTASVTGRNSGNGSSDGGGGGGGATTNINLSDPEQVRQLIDVTAQEVLGRRVAPEDRERILSEIRAGELTAEQAMEAGGINDSFDIETRIRRALRERFGGEGEVHDYLSVFENFASLLGENGGVGSMASGFGNSNAGPATGAVTF